MVFALCTLLQKGLPLVIEQEHRECSVKAAIAMGQNLAHEALWLIIGIDQDNKFFSIVHVGQIYILNPYLRRLKTTFL